MYTRDINRLPLVRPQQGTWPATQACALTGNRTGSLSVGRPAALNPLSHTSQGHTPAFFTLLPRQHLPLVKVRFN